MRAITCSGLASAVCANATRVVRANQPDRGMPVPCSHCMMIVRDSIRKALIALTVLTLRGGLATGRHVEWIAVVG